VQIVADPVEMVSREMHVVRLSLDPEAEKR
jgi:hypothetical protein